MDFSRFDLIGAFIDLDLSISRLHEASRTIDRSQVRSFYDDLRSLYEQVGSICDKYSKK